MTSLVSNDVTVEEFNFYYFAESNLCTHNDLVKITQSIGYMGAEYGMCNGITSMGMQAVLIRDVDSYNNRLQKITRIFKESTGSSYEEKILDTAMQIKVDPEMLAFFEGVELFQQSHRYTDLFKDEVKPAFQDDPKSMESLLSMIASKDAEAKGGIAYIGGFSGVYNTSQFMFYLSSFRRLCDQLSCQHPIALKLGSASHTIYIAYDPFKESWFFIDSNQLPIQEIKENNEIVELLKIGFDTDVFVLSTDVYILRYNKSFKKEFKNWLKTEGMQDLHKMSVPKLKSLDSNNTPWLFVALLRENTQFVENLLSSGADINIQDNDGLSALHFAVLGRRKEMVNLLISHGAEFNLQDWMGYTPLAYAVENGFTDIVKILLNADVDVNLDNGSGITPISIAVENGFTEIVKMLLDAGAQDDSTALDVAIAQGDQAVMDVL